MDQKSQKSLRQQAKQCIKDEQYTAAFLHLTHALNVEPKNVEMLSDRGKCLLHSQQFNLALEDADRLLGIDPESSKGHVLRAEIYAATFNFELSLQAFQKAFQCGDSNKEYCMEGINKAKREITKDINNDRNFPYVGCALGIFLSSVGVVLDFLAFGQSSYIANPFLKVLICILSAAVFFWGAKLYRSSVRRIRGQLLEAPPDIFGLDDHEHKD